MRKNTGGSQSVNRLRMLFASCLLAFFYYCPSKAFAASEQRIELSISAGLVTVQLSELARQFNLSFAVQSQLIQQQHGQAISGQFSLADVLRDILQPMGLLAVINQDGIFIEAAPAPVQAEKVLDEVMVTGIRQSLSRAQQIKQTSHIISDVIAAQDMAQYPDLNLAESLQRIAGISISREAGEGRQVSLRGSYPDFSLVTLNGMPVLANNDSPMDSRIQKQQDRSFDFNIFTSELFDQIQVYKAYSAEQMAGGLAGTIALRTASPFQDPGFHLMLSPSIGLNQYSDTTAQRVSGLISNTWQHWGLLFSFSWGQRHTEEHGANTFRWRQLTPEGADLSAVSADIAQSWTNAELYIPRGNRYSVWRNQQQREGMGLALEYKNQHTELDLDFIHARLKGKRHEYHLYPRGSQSTPIIEGLTTVTDAAINNNNELVYAAYHNARVGNESRQQEVTTLYNQVVVNLQKQLTPALELKVLTGMEWSKYAIPTSNKIYIQGLSDISIDYRADRYYADIRYGNDLLAPGNWQMHEIDMEQYAASSHYIHSRVALNYQPNPVNAIEFGFEATQFVSDTTLRQQEDIFKQQWQASNSPIPLSDSHILSQELRSHPALNWLSLNTNAVLQYYSINPKQLDPLLADIVLTSNQVKEQNLAAFTLAQWQINDWTFSSGVRFQREISHIQDNVSLAQASRKLDNQEWLPTVNLVYQSQSDWLFRLGLSRNVARPLLSDLTDSLSYDQQTNTITGFNNKLSPYLSNNVDISLETDWSTNTHLTLGLFYKKINHYIVSVGEQLRFSDTGLASQWQGPAIDDDQLVTLVTKQNTESAWLQGIEASLQVELNFLPAPFNQLGIASQATLGNGKVSYYDATYGQKLFKKDFPYLSKKTGAVTLYFENDTLSARVSASYRDKYIARVDSETLIDENETGFHASWYVDASLAWQWQAGWEARIDLNNLSNEREEQYSDSADRAYNSTTYGRSIYVGISYRL